MYNALRYGVSEKFLFMRDDTTDPALYYSGNHTVVAVHVPFSGEVRLPPFVYAAFADG